MFLLKFSRCRDKPGHDLVNRSTQNLDFIEAVGTQPGLRRQVQVLSAEGRLSAWILGLLPILFALYLVLVRPEYLEPLVTTVFGWLLVGLGVTLLAIGALWLRKVVKVEV